MRATRSSKRVSRRLGQESGFTIVEMMVALMILFIGLVSLAYTATIGFKYDATGRQQLQKNSMANNVLEEIRGLAFDTAKLGLNTTDVNNNHTGDAEILTSGCPNIPGSSPATAYTYCVDPPGPAGIEGLVTSSSQTATTAPVLDTYKQCLDRNGASVACSATSAWYARKVYITKTTTAYRAIVVLTPLHPAAGSTTYRTQTVITPTAGGCLGTGTHPYSGPCNMYLFGQALIPQGTIIVSPGSVGSQPSGSLGISDMNLERATIYAKELSGNMQSEQTQAVQGLVVGSGGTLDIQDQTQMSVGLPSAASASDNDQLQPDNPYQKTTLSDPSAGTNQCWPVTAGCGPASAPGVNQIIVMRSAPDSTTTTASTVDAIAAQAGGAQCDSQPGGQDAPSTEDNYPCAYATGRQGGVTSIVLHLYKPGSPATYLGTCTVASIGNAVTDSTALVDRRNAPLAGYNPKIESTATRVFGQVNVGCFPSLMLNASGDLPWASATVGWGSTSTGAPNPGGGSGFLMRITNGYSQGTAATPVKANAGYGVSDPTLPAYSGAGIWFFNGATKGYTQQTHTVPGTTYTVPTSGANATGVNGEGQLISYAPTAGVANGCTFTQQIKSASRITSGPATHAADTVDPSAGSPHLVSNTTMDAPMKGTFNFQMTCGGSVVVNLDIAVDLGQVRTQAQFAPPPT